MKRFFIDVLFENVCLMMYRLYLILNGHFMGRVLRQPYKKIWQIVSWGLFTYFLITQIMFPIIEWWQNVVNCINYVIWG